MARLEIELEDALLADAGLILGTETASATVEGALREVIVMRRRAESLERLRKSAADGAVDLELLSSKENYRPNRRNFDLHESEDE